MHGKLDYIDGYEALHGESFKGPFRQTAEVVCVERRLWTGSAVMVLVTRREKYKA